MTNETQQSDVHADHKPIPFGDRLKNAREARGLERKDAAAQLRLNEKIIIMLEKDRYPADLPVTFIRGYMRSYGKFLEIPDYEIKKAVEPIKPKPTTQQGVLTATTPPVTSSNYFMQLFTYVIVLTMLGLVGVWWYSHYNLPTPALSDSQTAASLETPAATANADPAQSNVIAVTPPVTKEQAEQDNANASPEATTNNDSATPEARPETKPAVKTPAHDNNPPQAQQSAEETSASTNSSDNSDASAQDTSDESGTEADLSDANTDNTETIGDNAN